MNIYVDAAVVVEGIIFNRRHAVMNNELQMKLSDGREGEEGE